MILAPIAPRILSDEDRPAALIQIGLGQRQRLIDPQPGAPEHDDQTVEAVTVASVMGMAHDRDDLLDGRRVCRVALPVVARRLGGYVRRLGR
jgi:hypothetical protein